MPNIFSYPDAKSVVVCGDIHGDFNPLVYQVCVQYDMHDTLVIVAGDCGLGFEKPAYYEQVFRRIQNRLAKNNCWILMIRGNHDNPSYFAEQKINHQRFRTIPDYSVINVCGHHILGIGGAISIDHRTRLEWMNKNPSKAYYWQDEAPNYNPELLNDISQSGIRIDTVVTHTAPSFCELQTKAGLTTWAMYDPALLTDCDNERKQMNAIYEHLKRDKHPVSHWYYGHFHHSWHSEIDGILFKMLDIRELHEIPQN